MRRGFTTGEVIVSVAILALLALTVPLVWQRFAKESHDIRRVGAVTEIRAALKNYFLSHGSYPLVSAGEKITEESTVLTALKNDFFVSRTHLPIDPESPQHDFTYTSDGRSYVITFCQIEFVQEGWEKGCENNTYPLPI